MKRRSTRQYIGKESTGAALLLLSATIAVGLLALPAIIILTRPERTDWALLAEVGDAYSGISAVISAVALCGVAASLYLQWRQTRIAQLAASRERHFELVKLSLEKPDLSYMEPNTAAGSPMALMANLWLHHWSMLWDLGEIQEEGLRFSLGRLFKNPTARSWWTGVSSQWIVGGSRRERIFIQIVMEEHRASQRSVASENTVTTP